LQVAADSLDECVDGVFFVELAPLPSPDLVVPTLAKTLGVQEAANRPLAVPDPSHSQSIDEISRYEAIRLFVERAQTVKIRERIGAPAPPGWRAELDQALQQASSDLDAEAVAHAVRRGRSVTLPEAIALALDAGAQ
jgi:predicted ATPase